MTALGIALACLSIALSLLAMRLARTEMLRRLSERNFSEWQLSRGHELWAENDRLRSLLTTHGIDPDEDRHA